MSDTSNGSILERLSRASSAEDFFTLLGVDFDPAIVNVARLHILRRMGQYLAAEQFDDAPDHIVAERCRDVLARAYADFVKSSPINERVFKVHKDAVAPPSPAKPVLVQLGTLK